MKNDDPQAAANLRGMGFIVLGMGAFVINDTLTKTASRELPIGEILAIRGIFSCLIMAPIVFSQMSPLHLVRIYSWPLLARNVAEVGAVFCFLSALFRLPIANVTGVLQAVPLAITGAAAILLREPVGWRRWTASLVGFTGVLLIVRPGSDDFSVWYLAAIATVFCVTARDMSTRFISKEAPSIAITFITAFVVMCAGLLVGIWEDWLVPSWRATVCLAGAAALVLIGYYSLIEAMRTGEVSAVAPFRYSVVLWAIALGYIVFGEVPSVWTLTGSAIVISAGLYTLHRERTRARQA